MFPHNFSFFKLVEFTLFYYFNELKSSKNYVLSPNSTLLCQAVSGIDYTIVYSSVNNASLLSFDDLALQLRFLL